MPKIYQLAEMRSHVSRKLVNRENVHSRAALPLAGLATFAVLSLIDINFTLGVGAIVLAIFLGFSILMPIHTLPAAALIIYAAIPSKILPNFFVFTSLPLGTIVLLVWRIRVAIESARASQPLVPQSKITKTAISLARVLALCFILWSVIVALVNNSGTFSWTWLVSFAVAVYAAILPRSAAREAELLMRTWVILGAAAGVYAVTEFALQGSPVFGTLYSVIGAQDSQHWSVYRAEVSFSHPLFAGAFFAVAACIGTIKWLDAGNRGWLVGGALSAAGVVATLSRGSMAATVAGIALGALILLSTRPQRRRGLRFAVLTTSLLVSAIAVSQIPAFQERTTSLEAQLSAGARETGMDVALLAAQSTNFLGSGPASSGATAAQYGTVVIENSYLQILISLGIPGLLLFIAFLGVAVLAAIRTGNIAGAAGLIAISIALAGFNAIDAVRSMHLLLGLALLVSLHPRAAPHQGNRDLDSPAAVSTLQSAATR